MGKVKQWSVEKKDAIETMLINMWASLGMDIPNNYEDIVQYCYEDVCETADPLNWHSGDVAIAFRRWIEEQSNEMTRTRESKEYSDITITTLKEKMGELLSESNDFICTDGLDGMYGNSLNTVGELREAMSELSDDDQITLVTIDLDTGDEQDHYPMHLDVIGGIRLTDGSVVNEVQFVQERNAEPDTRDKQRLVDALIDVLAEDIEKGDVTVLDELLLRMPFDVLKYALPEDMWADFE